MESPELFRESGIALASPEDNLDVRVKGQLFYGRRRIIPDLGTAVLVGKNYGDADEYEDNQFGIAIIEDSVVIKRANEIADMGFYEIAVSIDGLRTQTTCNLMFPKYNLNLFSVVDLMTDDLEKDPEKQYWGDADVWRVREDDRNLILFAPADSKFLSQLRFSFAQIHDEPKE